MVGMLMNHPNSDRGLASLRRLTYGASPMPGALSIVCSPRFRARRVPGIRMTEPRVLTVLGPESTESVASACNRPATRYAACALDPRCRRQGDRSAQTGEVCARAGNFMREY